MICQCYNHKQARTNYELFMRVPRKVYLCDNSPQQTS